MNSWFAGERYALVAAMALGMGMAWDRNGNRIMNWDTRTYCVFCCHGSQRCHREPISLFVVYVSPELSKSTLDEANATRSSSSSEWELDLEAGEVGHLDSRCPSFTWGSGKAESANRHHYIHITAGLGNEPRAVRMVLRQRETRRVNE